MSNTPELQVIADANQVAVVTGANTGIGKETARGIAALGGKVVLAVRDVIKGEHARAEITATTGNHNVEVLALDLASKKSIRAFAKTFGEKYDRLDILVHNAGVYTRSLQQTEDGFETTFGVNHLGTFLLTRELMPILEKTAPARIVVVSSGLHYRGKMAWDDLMFARRSYGGTTAYNQSKLANVLFTKALARRLTGSGITVNALHPGIVATDLTRELPGFVRTLAGYFLLTPAQGAETSVYVATSPEVASVTGAYFEKSHEKTAAPLALDEGDQDRLWAISEELLGLKRTVPKGTPQRLGSAFIGG